MRSVDLKALLEAGSHFGHKTNKWNPKASSFIFKAIGDTHIIDLAKTKECLEKAAQAVFEIGKKGGIVLFIGTKRQASPIIKEIATRVNAPYFCTRWIGGFITNWEEVKKNIEKLNDYNKNVKDPVVMSKYTKRERVLLDRDMAKLDMIYGGVLGLAGRPAALFVVDVKKELIALNEAHQYKLTTIAIVDTNADPSSVTFPIPANDDAVGSLTYIIEFIGDAYNEGRIAYEKSFSVQEPEVKQVKKVEIKQEKKVTKINPQEKPQKSAKKSVTK